MPYDPLKHHRRSTRLQGYDYTQTGAYFVTICTQHRAPFFHSQAIQDIAARCWLEIPDHFPLVELDEWIVMPNHIHGIIVIAEPLNADRAALQRTGIDPQRTGVQLNVPTVHGNGQHRDHGIHDVSSARDPTNRVSVMSPNRNTLAVVVRTYKAAVTTLCRRANYNYFAWQRNYYEHIIRSEEGLNRIRQYILDNPAK
jgi:REP element-mobilizing transposase RayT